MISIKLTSISFERLNEVSSLAKAVGKTEDESQELSSIVTNYLSGCNSNKAALISLLESFSKPEITELLALYYFFSKLTYDKLTMNNDETESLWKLCTMNADSDIARLSVERMREFLIEKNNLATILGVAVINLQN